MTAVLLLGMVSCSTELDSAPAAGMNLLLITVDTTRADAISSLGGDPRNTPNIDALAASGALFEQAYSASNVTKPSHVSIMTGQHLIEHKVFNNQVLIPEEVVALPQVMSYAGYRTAGYVAAVQLGQETAWQGFDVIDGPSTGKEQRPGQEVVAPALKYLRRSSKKDKPFFLWTHFFDAHTLYTPPQELAERYYQGNPRKGEGPPLSDLEYFEAWGYKPMDRWIRGVRDPEYGKAMYAAEVNLMDGHIGRILDELKALELEQDTVVVLVADHGESLGEHGLYYDHVGLYEVSLRIPLIVRVPGMPAGVRSAERVTQLDIAPTLGELFGMGGLPGRAGQSLLPLINGSGDSSFAERPLIFEAAHNLQIAMRDGRWKLILPIFKSNRRLSSEPMLFDLDSDPDELNNLYEVEREVAARMRPQLEPWLALGTVEKGTLPTMSAEVLEGLEDLGYTDGDEGVSDDEESP